MAKKASTKKSAARGLTKKGKPGKRAGSPVKGSAKGFVRPILGKSPLSKAQIKDLRDMLIQKRRALLGDLAGIEDQAIGKNRLEGSGALSNMPTHPADIGSDNYEQEFTLGLLESERALLDEINEALDRIDNNTYGLCVATGKPISLARLRARPWAKYCIEYAKMLEKGLVRPSDEEAEEGEERPEVEEEEELEEEGREGEGTPEEPVEEVEPEEDAE